MYLTAWLFGEDRLTLHYSGEAALTPEIIRYRELEAELENPQSSNFSVSFGPSYNYNNETRNAFVISTTTLDGLFGTLPPKSIVLVKGIGIVEWRDCNENTWILED